MKSTYTHEPQEIVKGINKEIAIFANEGNNSDPRVVDSFGEEWLKFHEFSVEAINRCAADYFDLVNDQIIHKNTYGIDIGAGTGRWSKYLASRVGFMEVVDPSNAIYAADKLLGNVENVRLTKANIEDLPFADETFDFAMSIGVLHHTPDTQRSMKDCVKKLKKGGYFYCYLYHNLETRGWLFRMVYKLSDLLRMVICRMQPKQKQFVCDILAVVLYMPLILWVRFLMWLGLNRIAQKMPLSGYANKPFFVIRNDSLDKFGTSLEQRFSKAQIIQMMENSGLGEIVISPNSPYFHMIAKKQ